MQRLKNLDYLRGLAAFGIMIYHYSLWSNVVLGSDTFLGRVGVYAVAMFYILSGLTLYLVYFPRLNLAMSDFIEFFKKRFLRIFPLLWLVTAASIILSKKAPDLGNLFLNLTGLFGIINRDRYFAVGAWSIGNELVFYIFFPVFTVLLKRFSRYFWLLTIILFGFYLFFGFKVLNPNLTLANQWVQYIDPLNQVFLFLSGFLIGHVFRDVVLDTWKVLILLLISTLSFIFYPVNGDLIHLVTSWNRLLFTVCMMLFCFCLYKCKSSFPAFIEKPLTLLGEISYSVYLIHPLVFSQLNVRTRNISTFMFDFPLSDRFIFSVILTLILSYVIYQYFEKFFMGLWQK